MSSEEKLKCAFASFDDYNSRDSHEEEYDGKKYPKELLYSLRMSERLNQYQPDAAEPLKVAARCQHIGRWEIPRSTFPMDKKGYLQWRSKLALYHTDLASGILEKCGYEKSFIEKVKFLLQKKELRQHHPDTQLLEDVICLVFVEHYLHDFALQHDDEKVVDILQKTIQKMSQRALSEVSKIKMTEKVSQLVHQALAGN
jgi:hypothetical protein